MYASSSLLRRSQFAAVQLCEVRAEPMGIDVIVGDINDFKPDATFLGVLLPYPATDGTIADFSGITKQCKEHKVISVFIADLLSLTILTPPGEMGADIVVGNSQRFGVPLGYGGPHAAFLSCQDAYKRAVPGRIIGLSRDASGDKAYRLALQAREQHIRREKANSNICTAQVPRPSRVRPVAQVGLCARSRLDAGPEALASVATRIFIKERAVLILSAPVCRRCSPTRRPCTESTTAPTASRRSPSGSTAWPRRSPLASKAPESRCARLRSSTPCALRTSTRLR